MPVETRYFRSDQHTVNGLTAYVLGLSQTGVAGYKERKHPDPEGTVEYVAWGIRVWKRSADGVETEITDGSPVAIVTRSSGGAGIQSAQWSCPQTPLAPTDNIIVRVYSGVKHLDLPISWFLLDTWQTEQLGAGQLDSTTWTIYYYTYLVIVGITWTTRFYYDTTTYNSRIEGFKWSIPIIIVKQPIMNGLVYIE